VQFKKNEYLEWMVINWAKPLVAQLADSGLAPPTAEEIGLKPEQFSFYSAERTDALDRAKALLGRRYGLPPEKVLIAVGCSGANFFVASALLNPGDEVLLERPMYEPLLRVVEACGGKVRFVDRRPENDFDLLPEDVEKAVTPKTKLVFITNMHNPTGRLISPEQMKQIGEIAARRGAYVIADEIYTEFLRCAEGADMPGRFPTGAALHENIIATSGFSKVYGIGGPRLGWVLGNPGVLARAYDVIRGTIGQIATTSVNILIPVLEKEEWLRARTIRLMGDRMEMIRRWCESRGDLKFIKPAGSGICFVRLPAGVDSMQFCERLIAEYKTMLVPGDFYGAPGYVRVSALPKHEMIETGLANASALLDKMKKR
jgi:hypothetical protein